MIRAAKKVALLLMARTTCPHTNTQTHTEEVDLLVATLDTAGEASLPDVLFCLKCVLAAFVVR